MIESIHGREILDSRGNPTLEAEITTSQGFKAIACVPSGASTGQHEACELRDGGTRYLGKGVAKAAGHIDSVLAPALKNFGLGQQSKLDALICELDGTPNKSKLGANALLAVSLAYAKVSAQAAKQPLYQYIAGIFSPKQLSLPVPMMNIINGGAHADNNMDIQEFMIVPHGFASFKEGLRAGTEVFHHLKKILKDAKSATGVGDEGGFAPNLESNERAIEVIIQAIEKAGYKPASQISIALDVAATEFFKDGIYHMENEATPQKTAAQMAEYFEGLQKKYPIVSIEDGMSEDDWAGWKLLTDKIGKNMQLVGDDLFVTNTKRLKEGLEKKIANSILIKVNQIGTLTETLDAISMAQKGGYTAVISHRSGETEDTTIADLAVGTGAGQIKTGSLCRTDRICKYNQLLRIEEELGKKAIYPGKSVFPFL